MGSKKKTATAARTETDAEKLAADELAAKRAAKFAKGASVHVTKALAALDKIASLGNKRRYFYSDAQAQKIFDAIEAACAKIEAAFAAPAGAKPTGNKFEV